MRKVAYFAGEFARGLRSIAKLQPESQIGLICMKYPDEDAAAFSGSLPFGPADGRDQFRDHLEEIAHDSVVGDFENWGVASLLTATIVFEPFMPTRC